MKKLFQFHKGYGIAFLLLFLIELSIALFVHDKIVRPYIGDILVIVLLYCFICAFLAHPPTRLPLYLFLFAFLVELSQGLSLVSLLGLERYPLARILLGSTFDLHDLLCYFIGTMLLVLWQHMEKARKNQIQR